MCELPLQEGALGAVEELYGGAACSLPGLGVLACESLQLAELSLINLSLSLNSLLGMTWHHTNAFGEKWWKGWYCESIVWNACGVCSVKQLKREVPSCDSSILLPLQLVQEFLLCPFIMFPSLRVEVCRSVAANTAASFQHCQQSCQSPASRGAALSPQIASSFLCWLLVRWLGSRSHLGELFRRLGSLLHIKIFWTKCLTWELGCYFPRCIQVLCLISLWCTRGLAGKTVLPLHASCPSE